MYFDTSLKMSWRECSVISSLDGKEEMSVGNREDNTASVHIEEIKCAITALPFVTKLSPVRTHKSHGDGWGVSLT